MAETFTQRGNQSIGSLGLEPGEADEGTVESHHKVPRFKEPKFYASNVSPKRSIMGNRGSMVVHSDNKMNLSRNPRIPKHIQISSDFIDINNQDQVKMIKGL